MKYIISEGRLEEFMNRYLDTFIKSKLVSKFDNFIVVSNHGDFNEEDFTYPEYMEFDFEDGRLWISRVFLESFMKYFPFQSAETAQNFISNWFGDNFEVEVKYVQS